MTTYQEAIEEENKKLRLLNRNFGSPCLVHATKEIAFSTILAHREIRRKEDRPEHTADKSGMVDKLLGIDNVAWISVGFCYNRGLDHPFGFIFDPHIINKEFTIFRNQLVLLCFKDVMKFWKNCEPEILDFLRSRSQKMNANVEEFINTEKEFEIDGKPRGIIRFWDDFEAFNIALSRSKYKKEITTVFLTEKKRQTVNFLKQSAIKKIYATGDVSKGEIICNTNIPLDSSHFLGFFIHPTHKITTLEKAALREFVKGLKKAKVGKLVVFNGEKKIPLMAFLKT